MDESWNSSGQTMRLILCKRIGKGSAQEIESYPNLVAILYGGDVGVRMTATAMDSGGRRSRKEGRRSGNHDGGRGEARGYVV